MLKRSKRTKSPTKQHTSTEELSEIVRNKLSMLLAATQQDDSNRNEDNNENNNQDSREKTSEDF